jgi:hypothetical protein
MVDGSHGFGLYITHSLALISKNQTPKCPSDLLNEVGRTLMITFSCLLARNRNVLIDALHFGCFWVHHVVIVKAGSITIRGNFHESKILGVLRVPPLSHRTLNLLLPHYFPAPSGQVPKSPFTRKSEATHKNYSHK